MKVYVTKYALTQGILAAEAKPCGDNKRPMAEVFPKDGRYPYYLHGDDFHLTIGYAVNRAEEMRLKKIASLKKQLAKLEAMDFNES